MHPAGVHTRILANIEHSSGNVSRLHGVFTVFSPDDKHSCNSSVKTRAPNNLNVEASINYIPVNKWFNSSMILCFASDEKNHEIGRIQD